MSMYLYMPSPQSLSPNFCDCRTVRSTMDIICLSALNLCIFLGFVSGFIPRYTRPKADKVGVVLEYCNEDREVLDNFTNSIATNRTSVKPSSNHIDADYSAVKVWTVGCHEYGQASRCMMDVAASGMNRLVVAASRETLLFVESMLSTSSSVRMATLIATNNELATGYEYPMVTNLASSRQPHACDQRASSGRAFWALVTNLLLDVIDSLQWRNLYLYVDDIYGLAEARQVHTAFEAYRKVASIKLLMTNGTDEFLRRLARFERGVREVKAVIIICGRHETLQLVKQVRS